MNSHTNKLFRKLFKKLPKKIQLSARDTYYSWIKDPYNPAFGFCELETLPGYYRIEIGYSWRAVGVKKNNTIVWFWIGSHEKYNNMIKRLK